jgi:hypothetical protein
MFRSGKRPTSSRRGFSLLAAIVPALVLAFAVLTHLRAEARQHAGSEILGDQLGLCPPPGYEPLTHHGLRICEHRGVGNAITR